MEEGQVDQGYDGGGGRDGGMRSPGSLSEMSLTTCKMFHLSNNEFEHQYHVDISNPAARFLLRIFQVSINDSSLNLQA